MKRVKTEGFGNDEKKLAEYCKALSHPARWEIVRILAEKQTCVCGQIVEVLPLAQATVSQHLKVLKDAGVVVGEIDGPRSCYCLNPEAIEAMKASWSDFWQKLPISNPKCQ